MVATVKVDTSEIANLIKSLDQIGKEQIPFATALALTRTAQSAGNHLKAEMQQVFDRPTPWVLNAFKVRPAVKSRMEAEVSIKDVAGRRSQAKYLRDHITGGERGNKPMEKAMRAAGVLPDGWLAVPSRDGVQRDQYGNVGVRTVARILAELERGGSRTLGKNSFRLFVVRPGQVQNNARHLAPGIWSESIFGRGPDGRGAIKPVFLFVQAATYDRVFNFEQIVERVVKDEFSTHFNREFEAARRSAR